MMFFLETMRRKTCNAHLRYYHLDHASNTHHA